MSKTLPARTPWFKCKTPPTRPGRYETRVCFEGLSSALIVMSYWTGVKWTRVLLMCQDEWRGLMEQVE